MQKEPLSFVFDNDALNLVMSDHVAMVRLMNECNHTAIVPYDVMWEYIGGQWTYGETGGVKRRLENLRKFWSNLKNRDQLRFAEHAGKLIKAELARPTRQRLRFINHVQDSVLFKGDDLEATLSEVQERIASRSESAKKIFLQDKEVRQRKIVETEELIRMLTHFKDKNSRKAFMSFLIHMSRRFDLKISGSRLSKVLTDRSHRYPFTKAFFDFLLFHQLLVLIPPP